MSNIDGMAMTIYVDETGESVLELFDIFRYEITIEEISKQGSLVTCEFEFCSRFFLGLDDKIVKQYCDHSIVKEVTLVAAPEGWLKANNYQKV